MRFKNKTVLITGGNSGIGRGIVNFFIQEGARIVFTGRDPNKGALVETEARALGGDATFFQCDHSIEEAVAELINEVASWGHLDVLVNNAGAGARRAGVTADDKPGERWEKMRGANLDSAYFTASYSLPLLGVSGGSIVNISSTATFHGNWGLYCVAKAAVEALTRSLAIEGAPHGVRANCVSPGWIATENDVIENPAGTASGQWELPLGVLKRMGLPKEIAAAVAFLASEEASFITGQTLVVDGGLSIIDYTSLKLLEKRGADLFSGQV